MLTRALRPDRPCPVCAFDDWYVAGVPGRVDGLTSECPVCTTGSATRISSIARLCLSCPMCWSLTPGSCQSCVHCGFGIDPASTAAVTPPEWLPWAPRNEGGAWTDADSPGRLDVRAHGAASSVFTWEVASVIVDGDHQPHPTLVERARHALPILTRALALARTGSPSGDEHHREGQRRRFISPIAFERLRALNQRCLWTVTSPDEAVSLTRQSLAYVDGVLTAASAVPRVPMVKAMMPFVHHAHETGLVRSESQTSISDREICPVCREFLAPGLHRISLACGHSFHQPCIVGVIAHAAAASGGDDPAPVRCPVCRQSLRA